MVADASVLVYSGNLNENCVHFPGYEYFSDGPEFNNHGVVFLGTGAGEAGASQNEHQ